MPERTLHIKFFAAVNASSVQRLMRAVEEGLRNGVRRFVIPISSPGGDVFSGLSAYNFLKGIPAEVITHNFGSVDSVAVVVYCAGSRRLSVPHARFLLHGVSAIFSQPAVLDEHALEERLKGLRIDIENLAGVVAATTGKTEREIHEAMGARTTLNPEQAVEYGLVHEIKEALLEPGAQLVSIEDQPVQAHWGS